MTSPSQLLSGLMVVTALVACTRKPHEGTGLQLSFEEIAHDGTLALVSDLAFLPGSSDFIAVDVRGGFAHMRLDGDEASVVMEGTIPGVAVGGVAGLVGVAVDPGFDDNRFFYVGLTDTPHTNVVRRYTLVEGDLKATLASGVDIFGLGDPDAGWPHNVSAFGFDDDGVMWLFAGDKTNDDAAQDEQDWRGSLLRIVPSRVPGKGGYTVPDNRAPLGRGADPAVLAKGIRSPWKALHHGGRWYFGDVGANRVEEINVVGPPDAGRNFGWPLVEGPCRLDGDAPGDCEDRFVEPWVHYDHDSSAQFVVDDFDASTRVSRSVFVGWIHRSGGPDPYGGRWNDVLVFGDMYVGFLRAVELGEDGDRSWPVGHLDLATAWGQAPDGHVYVMGLGELPLGSAEVPSPLYRAVLRP